MNMMPHAMASPRICTHRVVRRLAQHSAASGRGQMVYGDKRVAVGVLVQVQVWGSQYLSLVRFQAACMSSSAFKIAPDR